MKKGLIITLITGVCLGLFFLPTVALFATETYEPGAFKKYWERLTPTMRALANYNLLDQLPLSNPAGVITEVITADGWTIYQSGVQHLGYYYDPDHGKEYEQTRYYTQGRLLRYAVTLKLEKQNDGSYEQVGVDFITKYDAVGRPEYTIDSHGGVFWNIFSDWKALKRAWESRIPLPAGYNDPPETGGWTLEKKNLFWQSLYSQIMASVKEAFEKGEKEFEVKVNILGNERTFKFKLTKDATGNLKLWKKYDSETVYSPITNADVIDALKKDKFVMGDNLDIRILNPADFALLFQAVTNGTPKQLVQLGNAKAVIELTDVFLTGADIIEMGDDGVTNYLDKLGVGMGAIRLMEGATWSQFLNGYVGLRQWLEPPRGTPTLPAWLPPDYWDDTKWSDEDRVSFWRDLYAQIASHILQADRRGESDIFVVKLITKDGNERSVTLKLKKEGNFLKLQYKIGNTTTWGYVTRPDGTHFTITLNEHYQIKYNRLVIGAGGDGIYGTADDETFALDNPNATSEQLARALRLSQKAATEMMLQASVESGVSAGDTALSLSVSKGANTVDQTLIRAVIEGNLNLFIHQMKSSPWRTGFESRWNNWTPRQWEDLFNIVKNLLDEDQTNNWPGYDTEFTIGTGTNAIRIKFVRETQAPGPGFKIMMYGQPTGREADWYAVRHVTEREIQERRITDNAHYVTGYKILTGDFRGARTSLQDATVFGQRVRNVGDVWGDPNARGTINYDATTGRLTATIRWQNPVTGEWSNLITVTLDFSEIANLDERQAVIDHFTRASRDPNAIVEFHGLGDEVRDGDIFKILGLGFYYE